MALDLVPVSLWIEDFSQAKLEIERLRRQGVADFGEYLEEHPQAVLAFAGAVRTVWVNDATLALYGAADRTLFQGRLRHIFGNDSYKLLKGQIAALAGGRMEFSQETCLVTPRGGERCVLIHARVDPTCTADLSRVFMAITDITSVRGAENPLQEKHALYRRAFESAPVPMLLVDAGSGLIVDANQPLLQLLGWPALAAGTPVGRLCGDKGGAQSAEDLAALIAGKKAHLESVRLHRREGSEVEVSAVARTVESGGKAYSLLAFYRVGSSVPPWDRRTRVDRRSTARTRQEITERECSILGLIASGHTNRKIAEKLGISQKTVESHRQRLMQKLNVHKATDLVRHAIAMGILPTGGR